MKEKVLFILQMVFAIATFVAAIMFFMGKLDSSFPAIACMCFSLAFRSYYAKEKRENDEWEKKRKK